MKSQTLTALAVAGVFACGGAFAGGMHHGSKLSSGVEVSTPSSVDESSPWLANKAHSAGWSHGSRHDIVGMQEGLHSDGPVGTSSGMSGYGSGGFDSLSMSTPDSSIYGFDYSLGDAGGVDYWLLTDESSFGTGTSSSIGGSGSGGFDSTSSIGSSESFADL